MGAVFRLSELIFIAYFIYTAALALVLPLKPPLPLVIVSLNALILGGFALLARAAGLRHRLFLEVLRDWYPAPLMLLAYREMGWFAQPHTSFHLENTWVRWDRALLNDWGLKRLIESAGAAGPAVLETAYLLVYAVAPFAMAMFYVYRHRERVDAFLVTFLLGILGCYALFPYFPSEPPRTVFPGQDFPSVTTAVRRLNWWLLGGYGIHTSVFPSAHVAGSFSAAWASIRLLPEHRWVGRFLLMLAVLIATATVYGRYHYLADALAGFAVSLLAALVGLLVSQILPRTSN